VKEVFVGQFLNKVFLIFQKMGDPLKEPMPPIEKYKLLEK
jgi:hypothetical protein